MLNFQEVSWSVHHSVVITFTSMWVSGDIIHEFTKQANLGFQKTELILKDAGNSDPSDSLGIMPD